jgi:hypothetical protein
MQTPAALLPEPVQSEAPLPSLHKLAAVPAMSQDASPLPGFPQATSASPDC